jgi:hypothetical protein
MSRGLIRTLSQPGMRMAGRVPFLTRRRMVSLHRPAPQEGYVKTLAMAACCVPGKRWR